MPALPRSYKHSALLVLALLIGMSLACFVWVRNEQRQYVLNRQLIAALANSDTKQTIVLIEAGADPNTRFKPDPPTSFPEFVDRQLHRSPPLVNDSPTAFILACGMERNPSLGKLSMPTARNENLSLLEMMLSHGANV